MKIFGINLRIPGGKPRTVTKGSNDRLSTNLAGWLRGATASEGGAVLTNAYQQVVWVYRAVQVMAEQVANIPFRFSTGEPGGGEQLITSGPLLDFYRRPHPHINGFQYWELRILWLMLRGECFRIPIYEQAPGRRLRGVLMVDPARFQPIVIDHELAGWRYTGLGQATPLASQVFLPEEVWFEKLPSPFDFWRGMSPLAVASLASQTEFAAGALMKGFIENNADAGLIYRTKESLSPDQQEQLHAALRSRKRGVGIADRPLLLWGEGEIIRPQLSSSDLQFLENRKFSRSEICAAFGVPEEIVATTDHNKYDVMQGARLNFIENRVAPLCRRLEAEEDATVKRLDPRATGWFDLDSLPILQQARRNRLTTARTGFEMGIPFNELNRVLDLGFKPLPWGARGYVAGQMTEVGEHEPEVTRSAGTGPAVSAGCAGLEQAQAWLAGVARGHPPVPPVRAEAPLLGCLRRFLFEQRGRVLGKLSAFPMNGGDANIAGLLDVAVEDARLREALPSLTEADAGRVAEINRATEASLGGALREGLALAEIPEQLAARVREIYNHASSRRAAAIARSLAREGHLPAPVPIPAPPAEPRLPNA